MMKAATFTRWWVTAAWLTDILRIKFLSCKTGSNESEPSAGGTTC